MDKKEFAVGQKWMDRNGDVVEVVHTYPGTPCPVMTRHGLHYTDGRYFNSCDDDRDLISLVQEAPEAEAPAPVEPTADSAPVAEPAMDFKVGQVWETRGGKQEEISKIYDDNAREFPIVCVSGKTYKLNGHYVHQNDETVFDLVRLVSDPVQDAIEPTPAQPASDPAPETAAIVEPQFRVGQTWRTRSDKFVVIVSINDGRKYPIYGDDDLHRDIQGYWLRDSEPDEDDLIELIHDVSAPDAEVIADGLIAESVASFPRLDTEGMEDSHRPEPLKQYAMPDDVKLINELISEIAPKVACPNLPWADSLMDQIEVILNRRKQMLTSIAA